MPAVLLSVVNRRGLIRSAGDDPFAVTTVASAGPPAGENNLADCDVRSAEEAPSIAIGIFSSTIGSVPRSERSAAFAESVGRAFRVSLELEVPDPAVLLPTAGDELFAAAISDWETLPSGGDETNVAHIAANVLEPGLPALALKARMGPVELACSVLSMVEITMRLEPVELTQSA